MYLFLYGTFLVARPLKAFKHDMVIYTLNTSKWPTHRLYETTHALDLTQTLHAIRQMHVWCRVCQTQVNKTGPQQLRPASISNKLLKQLSMFHTAVCLVFTSTAPVRIPPMWAACLSDGTQPGPPMDRRKSCRQSAAESQRSVCPFEE